MTTEDQPISNIDISFIPSVEHAQLGESTKSVELHINDQPSSFVDPPASKTLAKITPGSPETELDGDRTLSNILENLSYLSTTLKQISTIQNVQGMDVDHFKNRVMMQLEDISKNVNGLFSTLVVSVKAENQSSTKVTHLSKRLDMVNDNLVHKIQSVRTELSSKIDSIATQIDMALYLLKKNETDATIGSQIVDKKVERKPTQKDDEKKKESRDDRSRH